MLIDYTLYTVKTFLSVSVKENNMAKKFKMLLLKGTATAFEFTLNQVMVHLFYKA